MRKALSLVLAFTLCLTLCACADETQTYETTEIQPETISVDELFEDLTNGAKCKLNVGKQVTALGQITKIASDYCRIIVINPPKNSFKILMPTEKLAKLSVGQFIAVTGIIESYSESDSLGYTISATDTLDKTATDTIFREIIANNFSYDKYNSAYDFKDSLDILYEYMKPTPSLYTKENTEELKKYLCGTWDCGYYKDFRTSSFTSFYITYNEDGSVKYSKQNTYRWDWDVSDNGQLHSFFGSKYVYILSDDVFICDEYVFVRQK